MTRTATATAAATDLCIVVAVCCVWSACCQCECSALWRRCASRHGVVALVSFIVWGDCRTAAVFCNQHKAGCEGNIRELASSHRLEVATLRADIVRLTSEKSAADTLAAAHLDRVHVRNNAVDAGKDVADLDAAVHRPFTPHDTIVTPPDVTESGA